MKKNYPNYNNKCNNNFEDIDTEYKNYKLSYKNKYQRNKEQNLQFIRFDRIRIQINFKNLMLLFYLIIIFLPISFSKKFISNLRKMNLYEEITIFIEAKGEQQILSNDFNFEPSIVLINGIDKTENYKNKTIYLESPNSKITLRWNAKLNTCNGMFQQLNNIISIDLSNFDSSNVISTASMFNECSNLKYINFKNFVTSSVSEMQFMFSNCNSIISLDLNNFNTKKVTNMGAMFKECISLVSLDLSGFDTSLVTDVSYMFCYCFSLKSLDIHSFNTISTTNIYVMFVNCNSLKSLDLSNFNTKSIVSMASLFENCYSLISLNLKNFNTKLVTDMSKMFYNCTSLISLDLSSFDISSLTNTENMFDKCNSLIFINLISFEEKKTISNLLFKKISNDLIYCINEINAPTFNNAFKIYGLKNNCSNVCFLETKRPARCRARSGGCRRLRNAS